MGDIAEMMLTGVLCECCGEPLPDGCSEADIPMYCCEGCAEDRGASKDQVCSEKYANY